MPAVPAYHERFELAAASIAGSPAEITVSRAAGSEIAGSEVAAGSIESGTVTKLSNSAVSELARPGAKVAVTHASITRLPLTVPHLSHTAIAESHHPGRPQACLNHRSAEDIGEVSGIHIIEVDFGQSGPLLLDGRLRLIRRGQSNLWLLAK